MATTQVARTEQLPNPGIVDTETSRRFLDVDLHPVNLLSTTIPEPVEFTKVIVLVALVLSEQIWASVPAPTD